MKGADECPRCGGSRVAIITLPDAGTHNGCLACKTIWEPFNPADMVDDDDQYSSFKEPCDNCAFRPGSPEREDKESWKDLLQHLQLNGIAFMCHKGVPVSQKEGESHDHPKTERGVPDFSRSRYCRGWLLFNRKEKQRTSRNLRKFLRRSNA